MAERRGQWGYKVSDGAVGGIERVVKLSYATCHCCARGCRRGAGGNGVGDLGIKVVKVGAAVTVTVAVTVAVVHVHGYFVPGNLGLHGRCTLGCIDGG